jgi:hypothetical protein
MFPMSHKLSNWVTISQRYNKANLTDIYGCVDVITVSRIYTPADRIRRVWTEMLVTCIARLCAELRTPTSADLKVDSRTTIKIDKTGRGLDAISHM